MGEADGAPVLVALTRIEGTLAVIAEQMKALSDSRTDHEGRLRTLEGAPKGVTARALWAAVVSASSGVAALVTAVYYLSH